MDLVKFKIRKLRNSNIGHYFETITNSELAGEKKPNPIIFELCFSIWQKLQKKKAL